jgi:hypothetical protein
MTEPDVKDSGRPLESWVTAQQYNEYSWAELVDSWIGLNRLLVHVLSRIPEQRAGTSFRIGLDEPVPLTTIVLGYLSECEDIVGQMLSRL